MNKSILAEILENFEIFLENWTEMTMYLYNISNVKLL